MIWLPGFLSQGGKKYVWERYSVAYEEVISGNESLEIKTTGNICWDTTYTISGNSFVFPSMKRSGGTVLLSPTVKYFVPQSAAPTNKIYNLVSYPSEVSGDYFYVTVKRHTLNPTAGAYVDTVTDNDPTAYPENGMQDGFWYVLQ